MSCSNCDKKFKGSEEQVRLRKLVCLYCKEGSLNERETEDLLLKIDQGQDVEHEMLNILDSTKRNCQLYWLYMSRLGKTEMTKSAMSMYTKRCENYPREAKRNADAYVSILEADRARTQFKLQQQIRREQLRVKSYGTASRASSKAASRPRSASRSRSPSRARSASRHRSPSRSFNTGDPVLDAELNEAGDHIDRVNDVLSRPLRGMVSDDEVEAEIAKMEREGFRGGRTKRKSKSRGRKSRR